MSEGEYIHKSHNVIILCIIMLTVKYSKVAISKAVDMKMKEICLVIENRYDVHFLEIGTVKDPVHFLVNLFPK